MKVTPRPINETLDIELMRSSGGPRSEGLHVSNIYGALLKERDPDRYGRDDDARARMELGFALEHMIELGVKARHASRPDELVTDEGIFFSPDLLIEDENGILRVGEIKCTWMSSRDVPTEPGFDNFPPKFERYLIQMKAYCYHMRLLHARLFVFFVNGEYDCKNRGGNLLPQMHVWDIEFTQQELDDNWMMLINYARHRGMVK